MQIIRVQVESHDAKGTHHYAHPGILKFCMGVWAMNVKLTDFLVATIEFGGWI